MSDDRIEQYSQLLAKAERKAADWQERASSEAQRADEASERADQAEHERDEAKAYAEHEHGRVLAYRRDRDELAKSDWRKTRSVTDAHVVWLLPNGTTLSVERSLLDPDDPAFLAGQAPRWNYCDNPEPMDGIHWGYCRNCHGMLVANDVDETDNPDSLLVMVHPPKGWNQ